MQPTAIRVLANNKLIMGKKRERGSTIPVDEFMSLSLHVRNAMVSSGVVEVIGGELTNEDLHQMLAEQVKLTQGLEKRVESLEQVIESLQDSDGSEIHIDQTKVAADSAALRKARKGDKVQFEDMDSDGNIFIVDGEVLKVSQGVATVAIASGDEHQVKVEDLTIV